MEGTEVSITTEANRNPEVSDTHEQVTQAFNFALIKFRENLNKKGIDNLAVQDQLTLKAVNGALESNEIHDGVDFKNDKTTYTNKITDPNGGSPILQKEGIPVEGLIFHLEDELSSLPDDSPDKNKIQQTIDVLKRNSRTYEEAHPGQKIDVGPGETDDPVMLARKKQEAKLVSGDERKRDSEEQDWYKALDTLRARKELVFPKDNAGTPADKVLRDVADVMKEPEELEISTPSIPNQAAPVNNGIPIDQNLRNVAEDAEDEEELEGPPPPSPAPTQTQTSPTNGAIPIDQTLQNVAEAAEEEEEVPSSPPVAELTPEPPAVAAVADSEEDQRPIVREAVIGNREVDLQKQARGLAEELIRENMRRGNAFNPLNWGRKVGLRIMEEYWRQRLTQEIGEMMRENANVYLTVDKLNSSIRFADLFNRNTRDITYDTTANVSQERAAGKAKVKDIKLQQKEGITEEGEETGAARRDIVEAQGALKDVIISDILRPMIEGRDSPLTSGQITNQAELQRALANFVNTRFNQTNADGSFTYPDLRELFGTDSNQYGRIAEYFATDLMDLAKAIKEDVGQHHYGLDQISEHTRILLANSRWAAETQANFNTVDRTIAWCERHRLTGVLINPATVGAAASIITYAGMKLPGTAGRAAGIAAPIVGTAAGAAVAGLRRNYDLKVDRAAHQVEKTYGGITPNNAPRREALDNFNYDTATATDLLNALDGALQSDISSGQNTNQEAVARAIANITTRLSFSAREHVDLVTYSSRTLIEQERSKLRNKVVEARKTLIDKMGDQGAARDLETSFRDELNIQFTQNREQKDREFNSYKLQESLRAAAVGGIVGLAGGIVGQEAIAQIGRNVLHQEVGNTFLENAFAGHNPLDTFNGTRAAGFAIDQARELYNHPGNVPLTGHYELATDAQHHASIVERLANGSTRTIDTPDMRVTDAGKILISGDTTNLRPDVKSIVDAWQQQGTLNAEVNIQEQMKQIIASGHHETFQTRNMLVDIDPTKNTFSMHDVPGKQSIYGTFDNNKLPIFDPTNPANKSVDWNVMQNRLQTEGWDIKPETVIDPALPVHETVPVLKEEFIKHSTNVDHREGYSYDQPGSQGNELGLHNSKAGNTVTLDISHMQKGFQHGLNPNPIDVQQVIKNHEAGWYFTLPSSPQDGIWVPDGADGVWDGKLLLNPFDANPTHIIQTSQGPIQLGEFSKMVLNQDALQKYPDGNLGTESFSRQNVFNLGENGKYGFIEAGRTVNKNGVNVLQHFATIRGLSDAPPPVPPTLPTPHDVYHLIPPTATEIIPPDPNILEAPPIIPIPFAPRYPLEPLAPVGEGTPFYYEMPITDEKRRLFKQNLSPTLKENSQAVLNPQKEVQLYFERQSPEYKQEITNLAEQITTPASPNLKAIVCIPVAGHEEGTHIYETLENYNTQNAPKDQYEILLFVNHPEGTNLDKTVEEIKRFQHDHPEMPVRMIYKQLPMSQAKMAVIRKYLNDIALLRGSSTINRGKDIILISNDADLRGVAPVYISNFIEKFDQNPKTDLMVGQLDWDPASYVEYPVIHAGTRLFQYLNLLVWNGKNGERPSSGANTALRASIYAGVGGYQINDIPGAEDVTLGQAIRVARDTNKTIGYAGTRVSRLYTSSRRAMAAWTAGFAPIEQWDKNWGIINEQIRKLKLGEHQTVDYDDPVVIESVKKDLEKVIQRTLAYFSDTDRNLETPLFKKAVWFLGIKYKISPEGNIEITKMDEFIKGIKRYQKYGVTLQQIKSGKLPADALKNLVDEPDETLPQTPPTEAIRTINAEMDSYIPTEEELTETIKWVEKHEVGRSLLRRAKTDKEKDKILTAIFRQVESAKKYFELSYPGDLEPVTHVDQRGIEWVKQLTDGKVGTQIKSFENALQALKFPITNFEQKMIDGLGGKDYAKAHWKNGAPPDDLKNVSEALISELPDTPALKIYNTNKVDEIFRAIKKGAAAIVKIDGRFVLIPPGQNLNRGKENNKLYVQVIDPVRGKYFAQLDTLINSDMVIAEHPSASWALIIERPDLMGTERIPLVTETLSSTTPAARTAPPTVLASEGIPTVDIPFPPTEAIRTINAEIDNYIPTKEELAETIKWVEKHEVGRSLLKGTTTDEEKKKVLTAIFHKFKSAENDVKRSHPGDLPPITDANKRWIRQTKSEMLDTQITSVRNALQALSLYNPSIHSKRAMINSLGEKDYEKTHQKGVHPNVLKKILITLNQKLPSDITPVLKTYNTDTVDEIIKATEQGAAAIVQIAPDRVGLIPPGQNLSRDKNGKLQIQIIDPLYGKRVIPLDTLLKSDMTIARYPLASPALIIERQDLIGTEASPASPQEIITLGNEVIGTSPGGLLEQINQTLATSKSSQIRFQAAPEAMLGYIKSIELPAGAQIQEINTQIEDSRLTLKGVIGTKLGTAEFDVTFYQTPEGKLAVFGKPKIDTEFALKLALKTAGINIEDMIAHLDREVSTQVGKKVDPNWEVANFGISGDKLAFDLKKKAHP